ncbi:CBS domain-containing protein [bacterium]|nr:CBS domain-containing protein [bacterium]
MKELTAKDIMNPDVIVVEADLSVRDLATLFTEKMISGAPVVDKEGKLRGVVSQSDIVRNDGHRTEIVQERSQNEYYLHGWEDKLNHEDMVELHLEEADALRVRDIMTPLVFKIPETVSLYEIVDTMIGGRIHRLIVTRGDEVVGIVTTLDLLKTMRDYLR